MLLPQYESLLAARTREELEARLLKATVDLGFSTYGITTIVDHPDGSEQRGSLHNTPDVYLDAFLNLEISKADPVMQHCRFSSIPILWNSETYVKAGQGQMHEQMAAAGLREGIATTLHLPNGRHMLLGLDSPDPLPRSPADAMHLVAQVQLLAVHAQEAAFRLSIPEAAPTQPPALTPRELEVLKWSMAGKTAWETGSILKISERTTTMHIANAMRKLGVAKRSQAVLKAYQLGLLA